MRGKIAEKVRGVGPFQLKRFGRDAKGEKEGEEGRLRKFARAINRGFMRNNTQKQGGYG